MFLYPFFVCVCVRLYLNTSQNYSYSLSSACVPSNPRLCVLCVSFRCQENVEGGTEREEKKKAKEERRNGAEGRAGREREEGAERTQKWWKQR